MSFNDQTAKLFGNTAEYKFQLVLFGRDALYIEGAKPIKLGQDEMIFKTNATLLTVSGCDLVIKDLAESCAAIVGKVTDVKVSDL